MSEHRQSLLWKDGVNYLIPFMLITFCFALWGFANDITNPMVKAFSKIFRMSVTDGALVQVAFYGGYFAMAFPAAMFIRRYSYKAGVLVGLGLYAAGALFFFPAKAVGVYGYFLAAYFIMTCGLYPEHGNGGDRHPTAQSGAMLQPLRLDRRHVRSHELHTGKTEPRQ